MYTAKKKFLGNLIVPKKGVYLTSTKCKKFSRVDMNYRARQMLACILEINLASSDDSTLEELCGTKLAN